MRRDRKLGPAIAVHSRPRRTARTLTWLEEPLSEVPVYGPIARICAARFRKMGALIGELHSKQNLGCIPRLRPSSQRFPREREPRCARGSLSGELARAR